MGAVEESNDALVWERAERVAIYNSPRRARYPSIARAADGCLVVLFTRQTEAQEQAGSGDLLAARSSDGGKSWGEPQTALECPGGEPRAVGTLTALASGRLIAPFAELGPGEATSTVRLLSSEDGGESWQVTDLKADCPLAWWAPCGKVIETADGTLAMPVYGAATDDDLGATIHNCALLRSSDGGESWGEFSWIARGAGPMIGAAPGRLFSFEGPSVQPLPDGRWLAIATARRLNKAGDGPTVLNEGPGSPQVLCRLWSSDEGRTWSKPDQLMPGAWGALAAVGPHTLCVDTMWCAWGDMRLEVSRDGFESFFQELPLMSRGWTKGRTNRPDEAPLPPTVPNLAEEWPYEHYGYPSALPLGQDDLVVVFARTQWGSAYHEFDPAEWGEIPIEMERIQAVFYRRVRSRGELMPPPARSPRPGGRWVLAERITVEDVGAMAQMPGGDLIGRVQGKIRRSSDGGRTWQEVKGATLPEDAESVSALGVLRSGRLLAARVIYGGVGNEREDWGTTVAMGMRGGYPISKHSGVRYAYSTVVSYSDDQGRTWHAGKPFTGPLKWALPCACHFIESPDGTVALPIFGCVTEEEVDSYSASNGVIRSHDGGETWGDFSFVFRTNPKAPDEFQPEPRYSEMDIVQLPNGHWVAYSRHELIGGGPKGGATSIAVSTDFGRTWRRTGASLQLVSQQTGVVLPDGGIALTYRTHSWQAAGVAITYDEGHSFSYLLTAPYETLNAFAHGEDEFLIFTSRSHRSDMAAGVYRRVPDGP